MIARSEMTLQEDLFQEKEERDGKEAEKPDCRRKDQGCSEDGGGASAERNDLMKSHLARIL